MLRIFDDVVVLWYKISTSDGGKLCFPHGFESLLYRHQKTQIEKKNRIYCVKHIFRQQWQMQYIHKPRISRYTGLLHLWNFLSNDWRRYILNTIFWHLNASETFDEKIFFISFAIVDTLDFLWNSCIIWIRRFRKFSFIRFRFVLSRIYSFIVEIRIVGFILKFSSLN